MSKAVIEYVNVLNAQEVFLVDADDIHLECHETTALS
jgi:hypothetical protein